MLAIVKTAGESEPFISKNNGLSPSGRRSIRFRFFGANDFLAADQLWQYFAPKPRQLTISHECALKLRFKKRFQTTLEICRVKKRVLILKKTQSSNYAVR